MWTYTTEERRIFLAILVTTHEIAGVAVHHRLVGHVLLVIPGGRLHLREPRQIEAQTTSMDNRFIFYMFTYLYIVL